MNSMPVNFSSGTRISLSTVAIATICSEPLPAARAPRRSRLLDAWRRVRRLSTSYYAAMRKECSASEKDRRFNEVSSPATHRHAHELWQEIHARNRDVRREGSGAHDKADT